ncbi:hypothetical protein LXL04_019978 [Taraxacum kok-saghyz]
MVKMAVVQRALEIICTVVAGIVSLIAYLYLTSLSLTLLIVCRLKLEMGTGLNFGTTSGRRKELSKDVYPRCFALEVNKDCKVQERRDVAIDQWPRRRPIRDGRELQEETDLRNLIQTQRNLEDRSDR